MIPRLQEIDAPVLHDVHETVLLRDASRPATLQVVAQGLGLSDATKGIAQSGLDELEHAECRAAIPADPVAKILAEFGMEDG